MKRLKETHNGHTKIWIVGFFVFANAFFSAAGTAAPAIVRIGFQSADDLFECAAGDVVRLEKSAGQTAMRWDFAYEKGRYQWCAKEFGPGYVEGMDSMNFQTRSNTDRALWVQVEEDDGEVFYAIVPMQSNWKSVSLKLANLTLNQDKVVNGQLDANRISKILVLDANALDGATGHRTVWFSDWEFSGKGTAGEVSKAQPPAAKRTGFIIPVKKLSTGKVGISAIPLNWQDTEENWLEVFTKAREAGVQILSGGNIPWSEETEPSPGVYDWSSTDRFFSVLEKYGFDFEFSCDMGGVFFHDKIHSPKDIQFKSFTDPLFFNRYKRWMTAFLDRFGPKVKFIVIHAEGAYSYFEKYPEQVDNYLRFIKKVRTLVKRHSPHIQFGFNADHLSSDDLLSRMSQTIDFMGYDILKSDRLKSPSDLEGEIKRLIRLADGKKIAVQNGGWSTSEVEESSDEEQVEFIREFYRLLYKYRKNIEYASFYTVYDDDKSVTGPIYKAMFAADAPDGWAEKLTESIGSFGLFRADGTPKPGWYELKKQIAAYYDRVEG